MTSCSDSGGAGIAAATETSSEVDLVFLVPSLLGFNDSGSIPYLNNVDNNFSKFYIVKNEVKFPLSRPRRNRVLSWVYLQINNDGRNYDWLTTKYMAAAKFKIRLWNTK